MKLRKNLTFKTSMGYVAIAFLSMIIFISSFIILENNRKLDQDIAENIGPTIILCKDVDMLLREVVLLGNSWIHTPNAEEKDRLNVLIDKEIPSLKTRIATLRKKSSDPEYTNRMLQLSDALDDIVDKTTDVMFTLLTDEAYGNAVYVDRARSLYENAVIPSRAAADKLITENIAIYHTSLLEWKSNKQEIYTSLTGAFLFMLIATFGVGLISVIVSHRMIIKPLNELKQVINALGEGVIMDIEKIEVRDEVSEMRNSVANMLNGLKGSTEFAMEIGKGNYENKFTPLGDHDQMGNALLDMRKSLKRNAEEERIRSWATMGIARLSEILQRTDLSLSELGDEIISFVVKYTQSNQGALFILGKEEGDQQAALYMRAGYAYGRKKYNDEDVKIELGEGLVGQCFIEGDVFELTEIPEDYVKITSGLGEATPDNVVIVPLKLNEKKFGVLELASFKKYERHSIDFLTKIAESIASSISNVKVNGQTKKLLAKAQQQAEELRAREEELCQNMEELTSTQDEMIAKEKGYLNQIGMLESRLLEFENQLVAKNS